MTQNRRKSPADGTSVPGADRFWGEFARTGSARRGDTANDDPGKPGSEGPEHPTGADQGRHREDPGPDPGSGSDPEPGPVHGHNECLEWCPICRSADLFRSAVTPELREQAETLQREALNIFQAFLAAYSERTGGAGPAGPDDRHAAGRQEGGPDSGSSPSPAGKPEPDPGSGREVTDIPLD